MKSLKLFLLLTLAFVDAHVLRRNTRNTRNEYKMCVPEELLNLCVEMSAQETKSTAKIICIPARDRLQCIEKIQQHVADFGTVDPEDMYIAANIPNQDFSIFEEIRTKEEPEAEFRYEAVAVIHKDLNISGIQGLKGLNSCHTGVGRNVGYKIPLTKLKQKHIIGNLNEPDLSARENELKAFSELFSKACIVGKWSPDPKINEQWKKKYSNLCALCENPEVCDYPDNFSGYDGALRCLAHNGGQVAWTKVIYVRKFFGLPVGISPGKSSPEIAEDFSYLCPDGSRVPVSGTPCRWAARPWQGYMANADVIKTVDELRRKIENLNTVGVKNHAHWLDKVLALNDKSAAHENKIISPGDYLDKANYTDVIERDYGPPFKSVRFCVTSLEEAEKCRDLSRAAFSRNIRPRFDCVEEKNTEDCLKTIRDNGADLRALDEKAIGRALGDFNLIPILEERYGGEGGAYYAVAVVKKGSKINSFADLKGTKSCHSGINETVGYTAPVQTLRKLNLIEKHGCQLERNLGDFFAQSCVPGATEAKLCQLCVGNIEAGSTKCQNSVGEAYSGSTGAFRCLVDGGGDVAFVSHSTVSKNTNGKNEVPWAKDLKSGDFELLCPDGGRKGVEEFANCNLVHVPAQTVVTSNSKSAADVDELRNALISASSLYAEQSDLFKMFGSYKGKRDLLFKDSATALVSVSGQSEALKADSQKYFTLDGCLSI